MRIEVETYNNNNLSAIRPNEKRIPIMRKRKMANQLMLGDNVRNTTKRGCSRVLSDRVHIRARSRRFCTSQALRPSSASPAMVASEMGMVMSVNLIVIVVPVTRCRRASGKKRLLTAHHGSSLVPLCGEKTPRRVFAHVWRCARHNRHTRTRSCVLGWGVVCHPA